MAGIALKPLTVSFHEYGFNAKLNSENQFGPWFMLSDKQRQQLGNPMGPSNPQALNRYSYVMNNPVKYTDPSGHFGVTVHNTSRVTLHFSHDEALALWNALNSGAVTEILVIFGAIASTLALAGLPGMVITGILSSLISFIALGAWILYRLDSVYGNQGLDITVNSSGQIERIGPPTLGRQTGIFYQDALTRCLMTGEGCYQHPGDPCPDGSNGCGNTGVVPLPKKEAPAKTPVPEGSS
jgi:hypothetical protein